MDSYWSRLVYHFPIYLPLITQAPEFAHKPEKLR